MKVFKKIGSLIVFAICFISSITLAQNNQDFDFKKAYENAKMNGVDDKFIDEYVNKQYGKYLKQKKTSHVHAHTGEESAVDLGTIYKTYNSNTVVYSAATTLPNSPQNIYCPNAGFEQLNFTNWSGATGDVTTGPAGAAFPNFTQTGGVIVSPAGNNVSVRNPNNYHTIHTTPATNSVYPNCVGYDSIAVRVIGTQTVSEIPVVNPNGGPASVRLNGLYSLNDVGTKITYNMALNPNNKSFSISYALILQSGGHSPSEQPYFSVKVRDQNGTLVPGCSQYTVTIDDQVVVPGSPSYDPMWKRSIHGFNDVYYRPWSTFAFDFSNYPSITSVTVEFYVGGCSLSGHYGYAYVDAQCSQGGAVASFCAGSNTSVLTAPNGYETYQWVGPSGPITAGNGGNTATATISPVSAGQVFTCNVTASNGCSSSFQTTVSITSVSVTGISSTPSCPNGNSGTAAVNATGSSLGYSYQWVNAAGTPVGNAQTANGLSPGNYTVTVTSPSCGSATSTVNVGISPPQFYTLPAPFCGSVAWINRPGGTNYKWYTVNPLALIPGATSSSLTINNPVAGTQYILSYLTSSGCKDSVRFTLNQTTGGSINFTNIKSICPGNTNGYAVINLSTTSPAPYSYSVTGTSFSYTNTSNAIKDSVINLSIGSYTANVFDGQCVYTNTFSVEPFVFTYTLTPQNAQICNNGTAALSVNFCNSTTSNACGLATTGAANCSGSPSIKQVGTGTTANTNTGMPCVFGNFYKNNRHQLLFTAAELIAAGITPGKLTSLAFQVNSIMPLQNPTSNTSSIYSNIPFNYTIKLKCTTASVLTSAFDNAGLSQVYNGNLTPVVGWNTFNFNQAYEWDGVSNVIVDICYNLQTYYTSNPVMPFTNVGAIRCVYYQSDTQTACNTTSSGTTTQNRPNVRFGNVQSLNLNDFTYTWAPTTGLSSSTSFSTVASPTITTVYTVTVNPLNQLNCAQVQTSTVSIVVPTTPTISSVNNMCSNAAPITLTATPAGGNWSGSGVSSSGVFNPTQAATGTNNYTYTIGSGTCSATNTLAISVEQFNSAALSNTINPLCLNNSNVNLMSIVVNSSGIWSGPGVSSNQFSPSVAGLGTHILTYNTNSLPTVSLCPASSSIAVAVLEAVTPTITPAGPYCNNFTPQTLTATPSGGAWSGNPGTIISSQGSLNPGSSIIGNNTVIYTITNGPCTSTASAIINVVQFVPATITGNLGPYCDYDASQSLTNLTANQGGVWSGPGVTGSFFSPTSAGAGTHALVYNTNPAPLGLCPDSQTLTVIVNPKPEVTAIANIIEGCNPLTISFSSSNINTGNAQWNFGDGSPVVNQIYTTYTYTNPGVYFATLTYTSPAGCIDTTAVSSAINVYEVPVASFIATPDITSVADGEISFTNQTSNLPDNTYQWDFAGLGFSTEVNPVFLFTNSGEYFVTLIATSPEGCKDTIARKVTINPDVIIYVPNAFTVNGDGLNDEFRIFAPPTGIDFSTFEIRIFDRWGAEIFKSNDINVSWNGSKNNSGETLKQDVYVWKITFKDDRKRFYSKTGHVSLLRSGRQ